MSDPENSRRRKRDDEASKTVLLPVAEQPAPAPPLTDTAWFILVEVVGGPMDGLRGRVMTSTLAIGRDAGNDLPLTQDPMVSARHARIVREDHHYWLEDLGSRNGVFIGDHRLSQRALIGPGTMFTLGQTQLEFMPR